MKPNRPIVYICIDRSRVWDAIATEEVELIIKNLDTEEFHKLKASKNLAGINEQELILKEFVKLKRK